MYRKILFVGGHKKQSLAAQQTDIVKSVIIIYYAKRRKISSSCLRYTLLNKRLESSSLSAQAFTSQPANVC